MGDYPIPSSIEWENQDVMKIKVYQDSQGNKVYGFTDGGEPKESMDGGGGGETWQVGLRRLEKEMEIDMIRFELEDAVLDRETNTAEGAAFGKANVAPASASLVNSNTFFEPFDKGQSHTYHKMKMNDTLEDRLHRKLKTAFMKEAMDSSQK